MYSKLLALISVLVLSSVSFAQKEEIPDSLKAWKKGGVGNLNFNQVSLTNWAAGGQSSVSGGAFISLFANYKKEKASWDNTLDMAYGLVKQGGNSAVKSDDKIEFTSKYGRKASKKWYYSGLLSFKTQFAPGYADPTATTLVRISDLFSPAYVMASLGFDYKPNDNFSALISPLTSKTTIVLDQALANTGAFGVTAAEYDDLGTLLKEGENVRFETGAYIKAAFKKDVMKNVNLQTKLELFSNYLNNPGNIDVNWETLIALKVNKFITTSISTHLIYDDDIKVGVDLNDDGVVDANRVRTQFKQVLAVGLSYKF